LSSDIITPQVIANETLVQIENEMVVGKLVYRDLETEFGKAGNKVGDTVQIRRPVQYKVRRGETASFQDTSEGTVDVKVDNLTGVDLTFPSTARTLSIDKFNERYLKSAMIDLAAAIDYDIMKKAYQYTYNWAGAPGNTISKYAHYADGVRLLADFGVGGNDLSGVITPTDYYALAATFTALPGVDPVAKDALTKAKLPNLAGTNAYMTQSVITHTVGAWAGSPVIDGNSQNVAYEGTTATAQNTRKTWSQTINLKGLTAGTSINKGDVFKIGSVYAVNIRTKSKLGFQQQFTVISDSTVADGAGKASITISPPIISDTASPYQNVDAAPIDGATITLMGSGSGSYAQNLIFKPDAFGLTVVPQELPDGAPGASRATHKGFSVRVIPGYDIINNKSLWRIEALYGVSALDPRKSTRLSGNT
jgi:hypothetical protein